jgi:REP element-mobilizing transposase RayT
MNYRIFGYVLMDNHYHILIQTMDKKLQEIMHQINNNSASTLITSTLITSTKGWEKCFKVGTNQ